MIPDKEPYSDYINASYIDVRHTIVFTTPYTLYTVLYRATREDKCILHLKVLKHAVVSYT